jgi:hypothetical protein
MQADLLTVGFGRTRMFIRYARSIAPWFHPPRWLFSIGANYFVDQVALDPSFEVSSQNKECLLCQPSAYQCR